MRIRAEKNSKKIREMTTHEKKIRGEWFAFKSKNKNISKIELKTEDISKIFSKMFG